MGRFVDSLITYRILQLLTTPFVNTPAYKLGIIDKNGKELKSMNQLNTVEERDAYTLLHRLVYRIKKIIEKVPIDNKRLLSLAAAYSLIRENYDNNQEPIDLESKFLKKLNEDLFTELVLVERHLSEKKMFTFKQFSEEGEGGGGGGNGTGNGTSVPTNNIAQDPEAIEKPEGFPLLGRRKMFRRRKRNVKMA